MVSITADPATLAPGASTTLTLHIQAINGPVAGFYLSSNQKGVFTEIAGQGARKVSDTEMTHSAPKQANGNEVTFQIRWTAPAAAGGANFDLIAVSANGSNNSGGDGEGRSRAGISVGCNGPGVDVYSDNDGDGFGVTDLRGPTRMCELMPGWSVKGGDCNDFNDKVNPNGVEVCNSQDDNCNGKFNEGFENTVVYKDADGDGYGDRFSTEMRVGCGDGFGWSSVRTDCDDSDRTIHPGAVEICNNKDDNCSGRVDEGARAGCGVGWCRRLAASCDSTACTPGPPRKELCNAFDDDCDGVIDNGDDLCGADKVCAQGRCLTKEDAANLPTPDAGAADASSSGDDDDGTGGMSGSMSGTGGKQGNAAGGKGDEAEPDNRRSGAACSYGGSGMSAAGCAAAVGLALALMLRLRSRRRR
jgi:hypothetical protein